MVCVAVPRTSLVCVTWVGPQICPHPRLPQDPLPLAALGTVAATFIVTAAGGDLATAMSARVSHLLGASWPALRGLPAPVPAPVPSLYLDLKPLCWGSLSLFWPKASLTLGSSLGGGL